MNPQETIRDLAAHVKSAVFPHLGTWRARRVTGIASSGDATFDIDDIAESAVESFLIEREINVAYYSEDRGLVHPFPGKTPEGILIIDPIDGTRGAIAGFEACVVSVAWTEYKPEPTLGDVLYGAITEIKGNLSFSAERGKGVQIVNVDGSLISPQLSTNTDLTAMAWCMECVGAPMELLLSAIKDVANPTTVRGGFFILNSSAFELTRLITGQLSGVVDVRNRLLKDCPVTRPLFEQYGGGRLLSLYGYDVAGAALIAQEAGCILTDAWGRDLSEWKLLDTTEHNFGSMLASSNSALHGKLLEGVNSGFAEFSKRSY